MLLVPAEIAEERREMIIYIIVKLKVTNGSRKNSIAAGS